jgi:hypothetical protein
MKKYRVDEIVSSFGIFLDEVVEAESQLEAQEIILNEIYDNIGNYIEVVLERIEDDKEQE